MTENEKPQGTHTANARRKYLHLLEGGTLKPHDLARIVEAMEAQDASLVALETENRRLREALTRIVEPSSSSDPRWWRKIADTALQGDQNVQGT